MRTARRIAYSVLSLAPVCLPDIAFADASQVLKSWRTDDGWLTELRQHTDGARVCATGKAFGTDHPFGLSIVRSGQVTLITLVDERQPPARGGKMLLSADGQALGSVSVAPEGPAFATSEGESDHTWKLISGLPGQMLSIDVDGRQYKADFAGIGRARDQLKSCERQASS
jgi:hypothetical protein